MHSVCLLEFPSSHSARTEPARHGTARHGTARHGTARHIRPSVVVYPLRQRVPHLVLHCHANERRQACDGRPATFREKTVAPGIQPQPQPQPQPAIGTAGVADSNCIVKCTTARRRRVRLVECICDAATALTKMQAWLCWVREEDGQRGAQHRHRHRHGHRRGVGGML
jgi:hypothetical protein